MYKCTIKRCLQTGKAGSLASVTPYGRHDVACVLMAWGHHHPLLAIILLPLYLPHQSYYHL